MRKAFILMMALCACGTSPSTRSAEPRGIVRSTIARQAETELAVWGHSPSGPIDPREVTVLQVRPGGLRLDVWRGTILRDHWHPYLAATIGDTLIALGGFQAPAAERLSPYITLDNPWDRAVLFAKLLDPRGSIQYFIPHGASEDGNVLRKEWDNRRDPNWPHDTVLTTSDGGARVVLTLISRETRSFTLEWVPSTFAFRFDRSGALLAWSRREGTPFATPGVPVAPAEDMRPEPEGPAR